MTRAPRPHDGFTRAWSAFALVLALAATSCDKKPTDPSTNGTPYLPGSSLVTIAEFATLETLSTGQTATNRNYPGQSITVPPGPSYNNIRFNWDGSLGIQTSGPASRGPIAAGTLFILSREYLGLPGGLSPSTPGFLAQSQSIEAGQYVFAPSVTLKGGTKYWFYAYWPPDSVGLVNYITGFSEDTYSGGDMYIAPELGGSLAPLAFRKALASWRVISLGPPIQYYKPPEGTCIDANFRLAGAPAGS